MNACEILVTAVGITNVLFNLANLMLTRSKASEDKLAGLAAQLVAVSTRVESLSSRAETAPSHGDLGKIYDALNVTRSELSGIAGQMDQMNANLRLLLTRQMDASGH